LSAYQDYNEALSNYNNNEAPDEGGPLYNVMVSSHGALSSILEQFDEAAGDFNEIAEAFRTENVQDLNDDGIDAFNGADPVGTIVKQINSTIATIEGTYVNTPPAEWVNADAEVSTMNEIIANFNKYQIELENIGRSVVNFESIAEDLQKPQFSNKLSGEAGLIQIPLTAQSFSIGSDGTVTFVNEKGELKVAGQVRVATFANAGGLEKQGGNLFRQSANSGSIDKDNNGIQLDELSVAGEDGVASIVAGALEMSNVDLSEEFTEMIVAQRGFQSNTKIITTSDEILQELMGLKR
jgi:flagellar hook protein FlgE